MYVGPNITRTGLVFGYDTDSKFYNGEPTTNWIKSNSWGGDGINQTIITKGNVIITDNNLKYNGYDTVLWSPGNSYNCYLNGSSQLYFDQLSTDWTFSCYVKKEDGTSISSLGIYMYDTSGFQNVATGTLEDMGNGWYRIYRSKIITNNYISLIGIYNFEINKKYYLSGFQLEKKKHPTKYVTYSTSRSNTESLFNIVDNSPINLSNVSFDNNTKPIFNGTNNYIGIPYSTILSPTNAITLECVAKKSNWLDITGRRFISKTESGGYQLGLNDGTYGNNKFGLLVYCNGYKYVSANLSLLKIGYNHIVSTYDGRFLYLYLNGIVVNSLDMGSVIPMSYSHSNSLIIGAEPNGDTTVSGNYFDGEIPIAKIYNSALSSSDVLNNFNALKSRFGL